MNVTGGTLQALGTLGSSSAAVDVLALTNSTLQITPGTGGGSVNATISTLSIGGSNLVNVISNALWDSSGVIGTYPTTLHLIQHSTFNNPGTNFYLGTLPTRQGVQLQGYIVDDGGFIDLVITNGPAVGTPTTDTWQGTSNLGAPFSNLDGQLEQRIPRTRTG